MADEKYKVLSLDIWDTVIRRKCHPDAIKEMTSEYFLNNYYEYIDVDNRDVQKLTSERVMCERLLGEDSKKTGLDDEYEIHNVFYKWIERNAKLIPNPKMIVDELYEFELKKEIENDYLDPTIVDKVHSIAYEKLAYVSDFYAGTEFIDAILDGINSPLNFDKKYISCECGYNKRSGRLFDYVLNDCGIEPQQEKHLGDNQYSDFEIPSNKGMHSERYLPELEHLLRGEKEKEYAKQKERDKNLVRFDKLEAKGNISVFFYGFVKWILESSIQEGVEKIYFFTREGEFYKQVYDEVARCDKSGRNIPKSEILEVSRLSTFCASLREISLTELMRIWNQYSIQPLSALFKSLGIDKNTVISYVEKHNIQWDEVITYPWLDERVINLFDDSDFIDVMEKERNEKRRLLQGYLQQKGLNKDGCGKIAIVDIGWRGTIHDNISYLLPQYDIKGYYIGMLPVLNEQPRNVTKRGYLNGYEFFDFLLQFVMPFEMISNSPNGSTVGYEETFDGVCAIRKSEKEEDIVYYKYTSNIQKSILNDIPKIVETVGNHSFYEVVLRENAHKILEEYIFRPQRMVANAYFELKHNEEFGVGEYVDKSTTFRLDLFAKAILGGEHITNLGNFLRATTWPQGYLVKYRMYPLLEKYNKRCMDSLKRGQ